MGALLEAVPVNASYFYAISIRIICGYVGD